MIKLARSMPYKLTLAEIDAACARRCRQTVERKVAELAGHDLDDVLRHPCSLEWTKQTLLKSLLFYSGKGACLEKLPTTDRQQAIRPNRLCEWWRSNGTSGPPHAYPVWRGVCSKIESDHHYGWIAREFALDGGSLVKLVPATNPRMHRADSSYVSHGHLFSWSSSPKGGKSSYLNRWMECVRWHYDSSLPVQVWGEAFLDFAANHHFDLLDASGSMLRILLMLSGARKKRKLFRVVLNTAEGCDGDVLGAGMADHYCDHMRCNEGGMTFATCKHGTRHLLDHLCLVESVGGNILSTDLFSHPCAYVRYWSGDDGEVSKSYEKCRCGRWFRGFTRREKKQHFVVEGAGGRMYTSIELYDSLANHYPDVVQIGCGSGRLVVRSAGSVSDHVKRRLSGLFPGLEVSFEDKAVLVGDRHKIPKLLWEG
jgi:hypothetical protein